MKLDEIRYTCRILAEEYIKSLVSAKIKRGETIDLFMTDEATMDNIEDNVKIFFNNISNSFDSQIHLCKDENDMIFLYFCQFFIAINGSIAGIGVGSVLSD